MFQMSYGFHLVFMVIAAATPDPNIPSERNMTTIVTEVGLVPAFIYQLFNMFESKQTFMADIGHYCNWLPGMSTLQHLVSLGSFH